MPSKLNYTDTFWKELAIPHKKMSEFRGCNKSGELNMNVKYDTCHTYDINFIDLHYSNNCNNSGKSNDFDTLKGIVSII